MTPNQQERIKNKIKKIKAALAADRRYWCGQFHDGQGLRYIPPQLYIELNDFTGGLRYFNWFNKNFSDDSGYPDFLIEWTIILFKTNRIKEAEKKAFLTFLSGTSVFDFYYGRQVFKLKKNESSKLETPKLADNQFYYSNKQDNLKDFSEWLEKFITSQKFTLLANKYFDIQNRLQTEKNTETRHYLIQQEQQLVDEL